MIADSENVHYNNPVNIKYTWRKEISTAGMWKSQLCQQGNSGRFWFFDSDSSNSDPFKFMDKGGTVTYGELGESEPTHPMIAKFPASQ